MRWTVRAYTELTGGRRARLAEDEALALMNGRDEAIRTGTAELVAWLKAVSSGMGAPLHEPQMVVGDHVLHYRSTKGAVVIFHAAEEDVVVSVLTFAQAVETFPAVSDLKRAVARLELWGVRHG